jgi:hypothetical protein
MATGQGLICQLPEHIAIDGADRIVQCNMMGETIITQKDNQPGTPGILFDCETQLSHEMCFNNNLYSNNLLNKDTTVKGYMSENRRIRAITLKGVKCSGFWMPLNSLHWIEGFDTIERELYNGCEFNELGGVLICKKYITPASRNNDVNSNGSGKNSKQNLVSNFYEHIDTVQWGKNKHNIQPDDYIVVTEKLHGTSGRCAKLPVEVEYTTLTDDLINIITYPLRKWIPSFKRIKYDHDYVVGSRRVLKTIGAKTLCATSFYKEDIWTKASRTFMEKLHDDETVYFEIVGFLEDGSPIMPSHSNSKLEKFMSKEEWKNFSEYYGKSTTFTYNCQPSKFDIYIYRIAFTSSSGIQHDLSWSQVKRRAEELGVKTVPELFRGLADNFVSELLPNPLSALDNYINYVTNKHSVNFPSHLREGVCIRVETGEYVPSVYKSKAYLFKALEGLIKENDNHVDIEETN